MSTKDCEQEHMEFEEHAAEGNVFKESKSDE
jgi:hypothetical protein